MKMILNCKKKLVSVQVELPLNEGNIPPQAAFYRDFATVKARWAASDSAYIAARFPDVIEELRAVSMRMLGIIIPLFLAIILLPLPAFVKVCITLTALP